MGEPDSGTHVIGGLSRVEELTYELTVGQVMSRPVVSIVPDDPMANLLALLREEQISGAPVERDGQLIGIVSVEDLVRCLKQNDLQAPLHEYMTTDYQSVFQEEPVVRALEIFARTRVGRLPVIDNGGSLVGIITRGDIASGLLREFQADHPDEEIRRYRASHLFEDIESDRTSLILRYRVLPGDFIRGGQASANIKGALLRLGADPHIARRCAISSYEAEMNLVIHTVNGGLMRVEIQPHLIFMEAIDDGPGIPDIELALRAGYSTASEEVRALGFGAGFGLKNIERCTDKMWLESQPGKGTRLEMRIYLQPNSEHRDLETILERLAFTVD